MSIKNSELLERIFQKSVFPLGLFHHTIFVVNSASVNINALFVSIVLYFYTLMF